MNKFANIKIKFYSHKGPFGCFSNFSPHKVCLKGHAWSTSEHYYQAMKFEGTPYEEKIRKSIGPGKAKYLARQKIECIREDWEEIKDSIMYEVILAKFKQNIAIKQKLLNTKNAILIEHTLNDSYWGDGGDGSGKNKLGITLMKVRDQIQNEITKEEFKKE